jgi:DNA topoisomerase-3
MPDQIVITEKTSQARDVRAAVGARYGPILPAEGHLIDLLEPEQVVPEWKRWSAVLLKPAGLYGTRPAVGGNKAAKLAAIREALRSAGRVWLATDCDREGQLIGQEILEHYRYRGEVMRVLFTAQDSRTIRSAFDQARPNTEYASLYDAAVARRQADQIYNLSLTRTATVVLGRGARGVIGVGRVKTPTLAIVCRRELEIRHFVPVTYFEVVATATVAAGDFKMRHAAQERILKKEVAEGVASAARDFEGPLGVKVEDRRQGPPRLHDLPSLQKLCSSRFGWSASRTLEIAQELYDGQGKKIVTYPRAEVRYLPESLIVDVPTLVAGLQAGQSFKAIPVPDPPIIRRGSNGPFHDEGIEGASHHAVIPNVNTVGTLREVWPRLSLDEKRLFNVIARAYLAALMPDFRYRQTTATLDVEGFPFKATGRQPIDLGWRAAFPEWQPADEKDDGGVLLPPMREGERAKLRDPIVEAKETKAPPRYSEGTLIEAMRNAWRFVDDEVLRDRLKEAKGIGTPATRAEIIGGLKKQEFLAAQGKNVVPTEAGLRLFGILREADPVLVDPGQTAQLECLLDEVVVGKQKMTSAVDAVCDVAQRIIGKLTRGPGASGAPLPGSTPRGGTGARPPTAAMKRFADSIGRQKRIQPPAGYATSIAICRGFLEAHAPRKAGGTASGTAPLAKMEPAPTPDGHAERPARKRRRNAATGTANPREAPRRTHKRKQDSASFESRADRLRPPVARGTPLKIPYGNKEAAQQLGARYSTGGWYAPPGVDLEAFRKRGWL